MSFFILIGILLVACSAESEFESELPSSIDRTVLSIQEVPHTEFIEHRIFVHFLTDSGDSISFYTDTGGGKIIGRDAVSALNLRIDSTQGEDRIFEQVNLAELFREHNYPPPLEPNFVYDGNMNFKQTIGGLLGAIWFADKVWLFDYKRPSLSTIDSIDWQAIESPHKVKIGFMKNEAGQHLTHFPRIPIIVAGDTIQTLFDSGAMVNLQDSSRQRFGGFSVVATSFIVASMFDAWRDQHPDWPFIDQGDANHGEHMIQVPAVEIGGHTVGPVWFTRRADTNFTEFMSQWMDQPIHGAIGGSCFHYFETLILDYRNEWAYFER
ncbi:MAG: hypothetical protein AAF587_39285 [Bacteroidota bacterium]